MLASASGPLGALLMIAPLAAIPVFAVMGVPHFAPVAASPADDEEISDISDAHPVSSTPTRPAPQRSAADMFAPISAPGDSRGSGDNGTSGAAPDHASPSERRGKPRITGVTSILPAEALDGWEVAPNVPGSSNDREPAKPGGRRDRESLELPREDDGPSSSKGALDARTEQLDDDRAPSAQRKLNDRKIADPRAVGDKPRGFVPDLLHPEASEAPQTRPKNGKTEARPSSDGHRAMQAQPGRATPAQMAPNHQHPAIPGAPEQSGWKTAARRLKELGIRKYRLESQIEEQMFLFRCEYPTPETPQMTELFEAVADTPLDAVLEALRQIDEWLQREDQTEDDLGQ